MDALLRLLRTYAPGCRTCVVIGVWSLASALGVWGRATLVLVAVALGGCTALPSQVERPVSYADSDATGTVLARIVVRSTPEEARNQSGFRLLPDGSQAFDARLALVRRAERTLDVQYYLIAGDGTGLQFLRELQISGNGAGEVVRGSEPDAGKAQMLRLWVTSRFVGEDLL